MAGDYPNYTIITPTNIRYYSNGTQVYNEPIIYIRTYDFDVPEKTRILLRLKPHLKFLEPILSVPKQVLYSKKAPAIKNIPNLPRSGC